MLKTLYIIKMKMLYINGISPEMALRLELAFGKSAESRLAQQAVFDLWQLESRRGQLGVIRVAA